MIFSSSVHRFQVLFIHYTIKIVKWDGFFQNFDYFDNHVHINKSDGMELTLWAIYRQACRLISD